MSNYLVEDTVKCDECGSRNLKKDESRGEVVCEDCGLVLEDKVIDQGQGRKGEQMSKEERVKKYLDFVRLYLETYKMREESEMRREANVVWKQNIEDGQSVSEAGYLEQVQ